MTGVKGTRGCCTAEGGQEQKGVGRGEEIVGWGESEGGRVRGPGQDSGSGNNTMSVNTVFIMLINS